MTLIYQDAIVKDHKNNIVTAHKSYKVDLMKDIVNWLKVNNYTEVEKISNTNKNKVIQANPTERLKVRIVYENQDSQLSIFDSYKKILKDNNLPVPFRVSKYLVSLVDGNTQLIDQLAKLIASISLDEKYNPKIYGIITNNFKGVFELLNNIYIENEVFFVQSAKMLKRAEYVEELIDANYSGLLVSFLGISKSNRNLDDDYFERLRKIVKSKPLKITDRKFGKMNFVNRATWVAFMKSSKELDLHKEYLGNLFEIINLNGADEKEEDWILNELDIVWILTIFATYGLTLLLEKDKCHDVYDRRKVVSEFIESCCIVSPDVDCYTEELYKAYTDYFLHRFTLEPMKRGQFKNIVAINCSVRDIKPRHNKGDGRRGLKGIAIDEEKMKHYYSAVDDKEVKKQRVTAYLQIINEKMVNLLKLTD